jgi:chemotaxis methyl-accepting protein methylase
MTQVNQSDNYTEYNRYPEIFEEVKNITKDNIKILSFGCSKGHECLTLKNEYFLNSEIDGYDINKNISICPDLCPDLSPDFNFYNDYNKLKTYDLIFCMSVLCKWPEDTGNYNIKLFEKTLIEIDKLLNVNGYLCIYNSKYLFTESRIFKKYSIVPTEYKNTGFVTKYNKKNKIVDNYPYFLFRKKYN